MERTQVDTRPIYTNYIKGYSKHKTKDGYSFDSAFFKRYYSTIDAEIYFGNEYVDDVVDINWQIVQSQMPLFGYNSYIYDEVALGARIVQGQFAINFISPYYLFRLLETAKEESIIGTGKYEITKTKEELTIEERKTTGTNIYKPDTRAPLWPQTFDIDIVFGEKTSMGTPIHIVLVGVKIRDARTGVGISGEPVMEFYSFIARDIKTVE